MGKERLIDKYNRLNKELQKYRDCSSLKDGWQTSFLAKKQRKSEILSQEITEVRNELFEKYNIEL